MKHNNLILAARVISMIFTPFYLPFVGMISLFLFSYLSLLPLLYRLTVLVIVYLFTILLPTVLIHVYRRYQGWTPIELGRKERRFVPYVISIGCYLLCSYIMESMHIPHFMGSILIAALVIQILCALINVWWKISTHMAAIGGVTGALFAFGEIFAFNPVGWICLLILLSGLLGTSRMILRQHTLSEIVSGFVLGILCAGIGILVI